MNFFLWNIEEKLEPNKNVHPEMQQIGTTDLQDELYMLVIS
jgi:hypothetical protein